VTAEDVLRFWFDGDRNRYRRDRWFRSNEKFDALCRERFEFTVRAAMDGALDNWAATPQGALALVIVLDQFPRNIYRGTHLAYAGDAHARRVAREALNQGFDAKLTPVERLFLYLPFEHSEELPDQDLSVRLFSALAQAPGLEKVYESAKRHRKVIRRFGRFPQRNAALGRVSTAKEEAWLAEPGNRF
jgi:uncharacterized protein (DUF924 family)